MRKLWVLFLLIAGLGRAFAQQPVLDQAIALYYFNNIAFFAGGGFGGRLGIA
jgi:hypothetical protein